MFNYLNTQNFCPIKFNTALDAVATTKANKRIPVKSKVVLFTKTFTIKVVE